MNKSWQWFLTYCKESIKTFDVAVVFKNVDTLWCEIESLLLNSRQLISYKLAQKPGILCWYFAVHWSWLDIRLVHNNSTESIWLSMFYIFVNLKVRVVEEVHQQFMFIDTECYGCQRRKKRLDGQERSSYKWEFSFISFKYFTGILGCYLLQVYLREFVTVSHNAEAWWCINIYWTTTPRN